MPCGFLRTSALAGLALLCWSSQVLARNEVTYSGRTIPPRLPISGSFIFSGSDSLYLNHRLLNRGTEYTYDPQARSFNLSSIIAADTDTLVVIYHAAPAWLKSQYGEPPLESAATTNGANPPLLLPIEPPRVSQEQNNIAITGAKSFRFNTQSTGGSNFGQSLDLSISGKLGHDLELTGAVSDRGYDPSYGTANSRLNELDKVNLRLTSPQLTAQVGDITLDPRLNLGAPGRKRVSGASFLVDRPTWHFTGTAARPKGRFESAKFQGADGTQGPYQIGAESQVLPVVPGSETVWLDGALLKRGANDDYLMDYPAGRITFNVNHPIDSRSRIEIDYEPLATTFRGELLTTGGGVTLPDSSFSISAGWLREGDDKNQLLLGDFSQQDRDLLASVGDQLDLATRSGVQPDTAGDFALVADSLPDSVYQYVGQGNGQYDLTFNYFGSGNGDYRFIGGGRYDFVGQGKGDYRPLVRLPAPQRTDYYVTKLSLRNAVFGEITADLQQSRFDRNLFSPLNDNDNSGTFFDLSVVRKWSAYDHNDSFHLRTRQKESHFKSRERLYQADFQRDYLLPGNFVASTTENLSEVALTLSPARFVTVTPFYSRLSYRRQLTSNAGGFDTQLRPAGQTRFALGWRGIHTRLDTSAVRQIGDASILTGSASLPIGRSLTLSTTYNHDRRTNDYSGQNHGTRYHQVRSGIGSPSEQLSYEFYREDSLTGSWGRQLTRNRLSGGSSRSLGKLTYGSTVTYQWLDNIQGKERSILSRLDLQYVDIRQRMNIGANYVLSDETRNSRGITYLEVEPGQGNFIYQDSQYVPDPDGNFIRIEEILSEKSMVRKGEKSFNFSKVWPSVQVRFHSNIDEELLPDGHREIWWALPFLSDETQPYLFYRRRYDSDVRLLPLSSGHAVNLSYTEDVEIRSVDSSGHRRKDYQGELKLRQVAGESSFEQSFGLFKNSRDAYYSGAGDISGYTMSGGYRKLIDKHELAGTVGYRRAKSDDGQLSKLYSLLLESRLQVISKGELRNSVELYGQSLESDGQYISYVLTDNHSGRRGAIWSVALRYGLSNSMRINFSLSGRHSDDRVARVVGRGEFVAGF